MTKGELALVAFRVLGETDRQSRAMVRISWDSHGHLDAEAEGDGSMDAVFRATDAAVGVRGEVTALRIHAFGDYDMVGKARITVKIEGREYGGRGSSPDAVEAAARAYLRAVDAFLAKRVSRAGKE